MGQACSPLCRQGIKFSSLLAMSLWHEGIHITPFGTSFLYSGVQTRLGISPCFSGESPFANKDKSMQVRLAVHASLEGTGKLLGPATGPWNNMKSTGQLISKVHSIPRTNVAISVFLSVLQASWKGKGSILWIRGLWETPEITLSPSIKKSS